MKPLQFFFHSLCLLSCLVFCTLKAEEISFRDNSRMVAEIVKQSSDKTILSVYPLRLTIPTAYIVKTKTKEAPTTSTEMAGQAAEILQSDIAFAEKVAAIKKMGPAVLPYVDSLLPVYIKKKNGGTETEESRQGETSEQQFSVKGLATIAYQLAVPEEAIGFTILSRLAASEFAKTRSKAMVALEKMETVASAIVLIELARNSKESKRQAADALLAMNKRKPQLMIPTIMTDMLSQRKLKAGDYSIILLLGKFRQISTLSFLSLVARHEDSTVAMAGMDALALTQLPEAIEDLLQKVHNDTNPGCRRQAVYALAKCEMPGVIPALIPLLDSTDKSLVQSAHWSLQQLSRQHFPHIASVWKRWWEYEEKTWPQIESLLETLRNSHDESAQIAVLKRLEVFPDVRIIPDVKTLAEKSSLPVRQAICHCVGKIRHPQAVGYLIEVMAEPDTALSTTAYQVLQMTTELKLSHNASVWRQWWDAMPENNRGERKKVVALLQNDSVELQLMAVSCLGNLHASEVLPTLHNWLSPQLQIAPALRLAAIHAVRKMKDKESTNLLIELLKSEDTQTRSAAHNTLLVLTKKSLPCQHEPWQQWLELEKIQR